jgi:hypothetical protein
MDVDRDFDKAQTNSNTGASIRDHASFLFILKEKDYLNMVPYLHWRSKWLVLLFMGLFASKPTCFKEPIDCS